MKNVQCVFFISFACVLQYKFLFSHFKLPVSMERCPFVHSVLKQINK